MRKIHPWEEPILDWARQQPFHSMLTVDEIASEALQIDPLAMDHRKRMTIGRIMSRASGWAKVRRTRNGKVINVYECFLR